MIHRKYWFLALSLILLTSQALATKVTADEWLDLSRYRQKIEFSVGTDIPKVVRVLSDQDLGDQAVLLPQDLNPLKGYQLPYRIIHAQEKYASIPAELKSFSSLFDGESKNLFDDDYGTYLGFDSRSPLHSLTFKFEVPTEVSSFQMTLGEGVLPPKDISVEALFENGETNSIFRSVKFTPFLKWPPVVVRELTFRMTSPHLLRIAEVKFGGARAFEQQDELVFAVEGDQRDYVLYFDPRFGAKFYPPVEYRPLLVDEVTPAFTLPEPVLNPSYDPDFDDDGVNDDEDLCPRIADPQNLDDDGNGRGDVCEDPDQDGKISSVDNCAYDYNPDQKDSDQDGVGDACDEEENRISENMDYLLPLAFGLVVVVLLGLVWRSLKKTS